jgi:hypothetical protein
MKTAFFIIGGLVVFTIVFLWAMFDKAERRDAEAAVRCGERGLTVHPVNIGKQFPILFCRDAAGNLSVVAP